MKANSRTDTRAATGRGGGRESRRAGAGLRPSFRADGTSGLLTSDPESWGLPATEGEGLHGWEDRAVLGRPHRGRK